MANGFRGEQSAKAAKKRSKDFDFPERQFGAGKKKPASRAAKKAPPKGMADRKGKGPARTIAEAKRRGLSTFTDKSGKKKAAVTAEELKASGLSLRDYLNKQQGKTRKGPKTPTVTPKPKPKKPAAKKPTGMSPGAMGGRRSGMSPGAMGGAKPKKAVSKSGMGQAAAKRTITKAEAKKPAAKTGSGDAIKSPLGRFSLFNPFAKAVDKATGFDRDAANRDRVRRNRRSPEVQGLKAGGMKKGYKMGGMKKGYKMGGMKKGYSMGGMKKKGMAAGGLNAAIKMVDKQKKGMAAGGMRKKGFSAGKSVRGVGKATKGFRPVKMVTMTKGGRKGGKRRS